MKTRWLYLVAAIAIILSAYAVKPAVAYFTDSTTAEGMIELRIGDTVPEIEEEVKEMTKKITVKNTGDYDIFVRVKAIYPTQTCNISFTSTAGWTEGNDGYYYYNSPVAVGESTPATSPLTLKITRTVAEEGRFNVIIIQEATKVLYNEAGEPMADWDAKITSKDELQVE